MTLQTILVIVSVSQIIVCRVPGTAHIALMLLEEFRRLTTIRQGGAVVCVTAKNVPNTAEQLSLSIGMRRAGVCVPDVVKLTSGESSVVKSEFDIDVVYTWVNHEDPDWLELYRAVDSAYSTQNAHASVNNWARFQNRNEIVYSVWSVKRYAPWIRKIHVVTNCRLPAVLEQDNLVVKVTHEEVFPDSSVLPTFNSRAIESNLHRIPGVAERILYFNDDFFLCQTTLPMDFFPDSQTVAVFPSKHDIPYGKTTGLRPIDYGALNACELLIRDYDYKPAKKLHHSPYPLLKHNLEELEERYGDLFNATRSHKFRDNSDIPSATTLQAYYAVAVGRGILREIDSRYVDIGDPLFPLLIHPLSPLRRGKYQTLCLNQVTTPRILARIRDRVVRRFLESTFSD